MSPTLLPNGTSASKTVDQLSSHLREILSSVNKTHLEPPLVESDFDPEILARIRLLRSSPDELYRNSLDTAFKGALYDLLTNNGAIDTTTLPVFCNFLDLSLVLAELEISGAGLPLDLIEELFDSQTIPSCECLFQYLESRIDRVTAGVEGGKGKALILLRLCNELLKRLSKTEDTIFCGRILIFLSKSFPIGERSGVNLRGDFNVDNVTVYDDILQEPPTVVDGMELDIKKEEMEVDQKKEGGSTGAGEADIGSARSPKRLKVEAGQDTSQKEPTVLDANTLYPIFWSLQHDFADPQRLFVKDNLEKFKVGLGATMAKFKKAEDDSIKTTGKVDVANGPKKADEKKPGVSLGEKRKQIDGDDDDIKGEGFNPKYLTSRELFELEISDLTFRRHVLVQALILIDFLLSLTPQAKGKWKDLKTPNRSVQYAFTLGLEDEKWAATTKEQILRSLEPDVQGRLFTRTIKTVLIREQNWVRWKAESCHPFDMPPLGDADIEDAKQKAVKACEIPESYKYTMGTPTLNLLWQATGDLTGLEGLTDPTRHNLPSPESFRQPVKDAELELLDAMFPDDIELAQTKKFTNTWKALRLASRDRFHLFNKFDDKFDEKRNDLEMLFEVEEKAKEEVRARVNQQAPATATPTKPQEKSLEANDNNSLAATDIDSTPPASVPAQIPTPIPTAPITNT
ncbi:unnamed protein product [Tuber melanosporum]|uniref:(Perigord truffle) hypothetical protein n=1 Tax=Tuber melanosporum (strain Mel28) TaxID=656061 RepID=D5G6E9_TUBMM|nr:uncharacterized protein GSTUM_00004452001 [Tuber melanosporum]CAZ80092.1 unnamed protein product [Tuber melanosporum]